MKVLPDIKDNQAEHLLAVLKSLLYVRTKQLTDEKAMQQHFLTLKQQQKAADLS